MKLNKKDLPFYAATVQTIQYSFGGFLYFSWIGVPVVGSMGALISFSVAYAASQISDIAKGRKLASWVAMAALMALSPVIIGTSLFYTLDIITNPVWRGIVAGVWGLLPDGATALAGFIAGRGLVEQEQKPASSQLKQRKPKEQPAIPEPEPAKFFCSAAGCKGNPKTADGSFGTQSALNGHQRKHKVLAYAVSTITPVTKEMTK